MALAGNFGMQSRYLLFQLLPVARAALFASHTLLQLPQLLQSAAQMPFIFKTAVFTVIMGQRGECFNAPIQAHSTFDDGWIFCAAAVDDAGVVTDGDSIDFGLTAGFTGKDH